MLNDKKDDLTAVYVLGKVSIEMRPMNANHR